MHLEAFVLLKPSLHFRVFVRGVIVHDQMQLKMLGRFAIDFFEKFQPLLMPVLALDATDQAYLKIIQHREQGNSAVADIVMRLRTDMPDPQRQTRLGAFQGLNLAFLIAVKHQRLIWRVEIQSDYIPKFFFEMRIIGQFEDAGQVRFQVIGSPESVHAGGRDPGDSRHAPTAPSRLVDSRLSDLFKDTTLGVSWQGSFAPTTRFVEQTVQLQP
jgi:hypothetical protein